MQHLKRGPLQGNITHLQASAITLFPHLNVLKKKFSGHWNIIYFHAIP